MGKKRTLVIMLATMEIGGVQQNFIDLIQFALSTNHRVIWLYRKPKKFSNVYSNVLNHVECINYSIDKSRELECAELTFNEKESIVWLTSTPYDMHLSLNYCNKNKGKDITPLYIVSNTKGRFNYLENYYWGPFKYYVFRKFKDIISNWHDHNLIRYFDINHFRTYRINYGIYSENPKNLVWKPIYGLPEIDEQALNARLIRNEFNIISITRFDFPHKQYLIGLIKDYGDLKSLYPQLKLHIIGYGQHENKVKETIESLPLEAQKDVFLYGQKGKSEIIKIMKNMHLNISVAACVGLGAKYGVLSLPARNFCGKDCEVYGYLPGARNMTVATEPGGRAIKYIEEVINMNNDEYRKKCLESYNAYEINDIDPDFIFRQRASNMNFFFEHQFDRFFRIFNLTAEYFWKLGDITRKLLSK